MALLPSSAFVLATPTANYGTVIGQVFSADFSKPIIELYYNPQGDVTVGLETTTSGGHSEFTKIGNVPEKTTFTYELNYSSDELTVSLNGGDTNHSQLRSWVLRMLTLKLVIITKGRMLLVKLIYSLLMLSALDVYGWKETRARYIGITNMFPFLTPVRHIHFFNQDLARASQMHVPIT